MSIGKVAKTYEVDVVRDLVTYTHKVQIGDEVIEAHHTINRAARSVGGPPVEYADLALRRYIMRVIAERIYGEQQ